MTNRTSLPTGIDFLPEVHDSPPEVRINRVRGISERIAVVRANEVHAVILHPDGSFENLGISTNLRTTVGLDYEASVLGGQLPSAQGSPATATSATSITATGTPFTSNQLKGYQVWAPITGITTAPVYGNIGSNTTSVITIDQWWTGIDGAGGTPASTNAFTIAAANGPARFVALTTDAAAASASDTTLASEQNGNGVSRSIATYAHTASATTYTQSKTWTATGTITALHKGGMFTTSTLASVGIMVFETVLNADATLANGDQIAITWTVNI